MTTESLPHTRVSGARMLVGAGVAALVAGLLVTLVGGLVAGSPAAYAGLVGTLLVVGVFGLGALVVALVAEAMPAAALLVALLTYSLQVLVMGLVFWRLSRSEALGDTLDPTWLGVAIVAAVVAWLVVHVVRTTRARIPAFDLPVADQPQQVPGSRTAGEVR